MAEKETQNQNITGLDDAANRKEAEYDLVSALLSAAEFKTADANVTEVDIKRNGKVLFTVHVHPLSAPDARIARKKATTYMPNPNNKKLPPIEKDYNASLCNSWLIYLATTEEDRQKIWGNQTLMRKYGLALPVESVDTLLTIGEKDKLADVVVKISGLGDDDDEEETVDEETFLQGSH